MQRIFHILIGVQAVIWILIAIIGFNTSPLTTALAATQIPGLLLLEQLGWCCGFGGGFVITDVVVNRWGGLTSAGAPLLALANTLVLALVLLPAAILWSHTRSRVGAT